MIKLPAPSEGKKYYFASDFHLGAPNHSESRKREDDVVRWLDEIKGQTEALFLVGDVFDFWFEFKHVIPKGFIRFQGKVAEFTDAGIPVHFFVGNHDMWVFDYFKKELDWKIYYHPEEFQIGNKNLLIGHGDGIGPNDGFYKFLKKIFRNGFFQWLFAFFHPYIGMSVAQAWSKSSRNGNIEKDKEFLGEGEWLLQFCKQQTKNRDFDYYIFGHRHIPMDIQIENSSRYINLGEWLHSNTFGSFDGKDFALSSFNKKATIYRSTT